jgi:hypothetical protein
LRRKADGVAPLFRDEDGFDRKIIAGLHQVAARPVFR